MALQNNLKNLLKVRGITAREIAEKSGFDHSTIRKTITGSRKGRHPRKAIAKYLKVNFSSLWGPESSLIMKRLIEQAIEDRAKLHAEQERKRLVSNYLEQSLTGSKKVSNG